MKRTTHWPLAVFLTVCLIGCSSPKVFVGQTGHHEVGESVFGEDPNVAVFLVGALSPADTVASSRLLSAVRTRIAQSPAEKNVLIFLGDQLSPGGLPDSGDVRRQRSDWMLGEMTKLAGLVDELVVVPGDYEWAGGSVGGLRSVGNLQSYFEKVDAENIRVMPEDGFPGPARLKVTDDIVVLALNSQWWLHPHEKSYGDTGDYDLREAGDFLAELEERLRKDEDETVILISHHPVVSSGMRSGHFPASYHLYPVPVVGTMSAFYRKLVGNRQDLQHHMYSEFSRELRRLTGRHENLMLVSGHDTGFQYNTTGPQHTPQHHIVIGPGTGKRFVKPGNRTILASTDPGYGIITFWNDRRVTLNFSPVTNSEPLSTTLFRIDPEEPIQIPMTNGIQRNFPDSVFLPVNPDYYIGDNAFVTHVLGTHYRDTWAAPVALEVLDIATEHGGLRPVKIGGRGQTVSLRVESASGRQYVLRSVDKEAGRAWPPELRNTFANSITQDQISLMHPFAAVVVARLADFAGVYHTNPRLVYVPDDPLLGPYRDLMAGRVVLFEERPDEDLSDLESMGRTKNAVSYRTLYRKLDDDNDNRVDGHAFARARLFDILISDWDRHEDQWRWAEFENPDKGSTYRPIPRDRDVAFMKMDGLIPRIAQMTSLRIWQDFEKDFGYLKGLTRNGLWQDRRLTSEVTTDDWVSLARHIQESLTDEAIAAAFAVLPDTVRALDDEELTSTLKYRRDRLPEIARKFSLILARDVDVVGSNKHEEFVVERINRDSTRVTVYKTKKTGDRVKVIYERSILTSETREVFLYGQGGNDQFKIRGSVDDGVQITAIGGAGYDVFVDSSSVDGFKNKTRFLDTPDNEFHTGDETSLNVSSSPSINSYNPRAYKHDAVKPVAFFGSNKDDGIFVGGGIAKTFHGFRRQPYKQRHEVAANFAAATRAFNVKYAGDFKSVFEKTDLGLHAGVFSPNNIRNFYGLGNETEDDSASASFYQAQLSRVEADASVSYQLGHSTIGLSPSFEYVDVREDTTRFIGQPQSGINPGSFEDQWFAGLEASFHISSVDRPGNPRNGFRWWATTGTNFGIRNTSATYATVASDLRVYFPIYYQPQITIAARTGGRHIVGPFPFYSASTLGGSSNLRGYRGTRFAGRTAFFYNVELRSALFRYNTYLSYGTVGVNAFYDRGRVWTDDESSGIWHGGYGGGIWTYVFDSIMANAAYARSPEDQTITVGLGFHF